MQIDANFGRVLIRVDTIVLFRKIADCENQKILEVIVELVSKELNHLAAILHVYDFYEVKKILFFKKKGEILLHF